MTYTYMFAFIWGRGAECDNQIALTQFTRGRFRIAIKIMDYPGCH